MRMVPLGLVGVCVLATVGGVRGEGGAGAQKALALQERARDCVRLARANMEYVQQPLGREALQRGDLARALAGLGKFAEAIKLASAIGESSTRNEVLAAVAEMQAKAGDVAGAKATLAKALALMPAGKTDDLEYIGDAQARIGDLAGAKATVERITSMYGKSQVLGTLASAQWKAGDHAAARASFLAEKQAIKAEPSMPPVVGLFFVLRRQEEVGDWAGAMETAQEIGDDYMEAELLVKMAEGHAAAGEKAKAAAALKDAAEFLAKSVAAGKGAREGATAAVWHRIGKCMRELGDGAGVKRAQAGEKAAIEKAIGEALAMDAKDSSRPAGLCRVAVVQVQMEDGAGAKATLKLADEALERLAAEGVPQTWALWQMARVLAEADPPAARAALVRAMRFPRGSSSEFTIEAAVIAGKTAAAEGAEVDLDWLEQMVSVEAKAAAYAAAAASLAKGE